jgi:hypothetical protein
MAELTRLELAHKRWHSGVAKLVSPPYTGTPEELEKIKPILEEAREGFRKEFLMDKKEAIEFLSRNRLEVENFFGDLMLRYPCQEVYDTLYNYYARNFPSWQRERIEGIVYQKCGIEKFKNED